MRDQARRGFLVVALGAAIIPTADASAALTFNFSPTGNPQADAGFAAAGQWWSDLFADDITININAGFSSLGGSTLAQAGSNSILPNYSHVRNALIANATSADDATAVASLPTGPALTFITNDRAGNFITDNNGTANNVFLDVNRANAKALGLLAANDAGVDAEITFNSDFIFDFNRNDGISGGAFDFVAIAAHEIGHALGFVSGVDIVDLVSGNGPNAGDDLNGGSPGIGTLDGFAVFSVLDLFRFTTETGPGVLDFGTGGTAYFSLDAGATNLGLFSTGDFNGDGNQASHWKDSLGLGLMDPTLAPGEFVNITGLDIRTLDVIGYDLIPEPTALALLSLGTLGLITRRRAA